MGAVVGTIRPTSEQAEQLRAVGAALMRSLSQNRAVTDGNRPLALAGVIAFVCLDGLHLEMTNDEPYDLTMAVATDMTDIAAALRTAGIS